MGELSKIEWCDHTVNFWEGCTKVAPGCANCYAADRAKRWSSVEWGAGRPRRKVKAGIPLARKLQRQAERDGTRPRIFVNSLSDFFDDEAPGLWRAEAWAVIGECDQLQWLILTKRPENIPTMLPGDWGAGWCHVALGATVSDQPTADRNVRLLLQCAASMYFVSYEPALGPVRLDAEVDWHDGPLSHLDALDWIIVGGESGPHARPCDIAWIRSVVEQCRAAGTACFVKQLGARPWELRGDEFTGARMASLNLRSRKGNDPAEWPEDLRVRDFPR